MKKILLIFTVVLATVVSVQAQYVLTMDGEVIGDQITVTPDSPSATELQLDLIFTNESDEDAVIKVARNEVEMVSGSESYFCWGACYPPATDTSGVAMTIAAGGSSNEGDFSAHFMTGVNGNSVISYTFYNIDNPELAVTVTVNFNTNPFLLSMDGEITGNEITIIPDDPGATEIQLDLIFTNNSDASAAIKVARNEIEMAAGSESYFCWGACYPPATDTSGMSMTIDAGASSGEGDFSAHYTIGDEGISKISYTFYNIDNPDEAVTVLVNFDTRPSGVNENIFKDTWISDLYPNPATSVVKIDYNFPAAVTNAEVKVVNLVGSVVMEQKLDASANNHSINISELNSGIYFYSLFLNEEVYSTKKLIVK